MKRAIITLILGIYLISFVSFASALMINSVSTYPEEVAPGETAQVSIELKNNENFDIEDLSISLDLTNVPFAPYNAGTDDSISELLEGKTKSAEFEIVALDSATVGIYKIPLTIQYRESGENLTKTKSSLISVKVNSKPVLETSVENSLLLKNSQNKVSVKIINRGLADVKFLDIELGTSSYYTMISPAKAYIGDVDSNDFQTTEYTIFFKDNSPRTISIPAKLTYQDKTGKEYTLDSTIDLKVYSQEDATSLGLLQPNYGIYYVLLAVFLILVFILYRVIRKRKSKEE